MKMAKKSLSITLALIMAIGMFVMSTSAAEPADYAAVNTAIATKLPSEANRYFYIDEAAGLIDDVLALIDWDLSNENQTIVDGYVTMINDLGTLLKKTVTDGSQSPLVFAYGTGFSFAYSYPYGASGLKFYPLRDEQKAVNTLALDASKTVVPLVSRYAGDQTFAVTVSLGSNALLCAGGIPVLFDKTRLEVVGVDNALDNVTLTPTMIGSNLADEYDFTTVLNPTDGFWPAGYDNSQLAGISITLSTNFEDGAPYSVLPVSQESFLSIQFKVKTGAPAGEAIVYVAPEFKRDAYNTNNSLYFGRAIDGNSFVTYDALSAYGATVNVTAAVASVEVVDVILGDADLSGSVDIFDALLTLQATVGMESLSDKQILQANVDIAANETGTVDIYDALAILQFSVGLITSF